MFDLAERTVDDVQAIGSARREIEETRTMLIETQAQFKATESALHESWLFDPKGEPRVTVATSDGVTSTYWRGPGQDGWTRIATGPSLQQKFSPSFVDASGRFYVTANVGRGGTAALKLFDFAAGAPEPQPIVTTPGFDFRGGLVADASGETFGNPGHHRCRDDGLVRPANAGAAALGRCEISRSASTG